MVVDAYQKTGGDINSALLLLCSFHLLYIVDGLWFEVVCESMMNRIFQFLISNVF
jgi:hypothetical protein